MARGRKAADAAAEVIERETDADPTPVDVNELHESHEPNEGVPVTAAAETAVHPPEIDESDALPMDIPESDTKEAKFNGEMVRAVMVRGKIEFAKAGTQENTFWARADKDTFAYTCDFILRHDQDDEKIAELAGMTLKFNRFPIVPGQASQQIVSDMCRAYNIPLTQLGRHLASIDQVPVIIRVKTSIREDKQTGGTKTSHYVNAILRDIEFERAHGGGQ